jgi:V8-like Glu-specific endopeptidase
MEIFTIIVAVTGLLFSAFAVNKADNQDVNQKTDSMVLIEKTSQNKSKVVTMMITVRGVDHNSATGFFVNYRGKSYGITNGHVCYDVFFNEKFELAYYDSLLDEVGRVNKKDLFLYKHHDLCVFQVSPNQKTNAFYISGSPLKANATLFYTGRPMLMPVITQQGLYVGNEKAEIPINRPLSNCNTGAFNIKIDPRFGLPVCVFSGMSALTTMLGGPGASGSPVYNEQNLLEGVIFTGYTVGAGWMQFVDKAYLVYFLNSIRTNNKGK